ncbi:hypothetical protein D5R81_04625 [Parashewanella spongiae]|uniref:Uncharacterized protein n=1 Tax=Parashewanella spongiae TaxID=342950 RepID=A0A3A6UHS3_9GAMM|nr:hypothetical protein [Parashewanella spongiae]MCL1077313.1 hypothetical protein [Parashewanella spongiae]RJY18600.1 hypothetical protein D5R81_04625 [Parashewanella spongiae]
MSQKNIFFFFIVIIIVAGISYQQAGSDSKSIPPAKQIPLTSSSELDANHSIASFQSQDINESQEKHKATLTEVSGDEKQQELQQKIERLTQELASLNTPTFCTEYNAEKNRCITFPTDINIEEHLFVRNGAVDAEPVQSLIQSDNFNVILEELYNNKTSEEAIEIEAQLNERLNSLWNQGLEGNANGFYCGNNICAIEFTDINTESYKIAAKVLHGKDDRLGVIFQSPDNGRLIYIINAQGGVSSTAKVTPH